MSRLVYRINHLIDWYEFLKVGSKNNLKIRIYKKIYK